MWTKYAYNVGGLLFTLDEIEHGVLRCNRGHPKDQKPLFSDEEPRISLALGSLDPRIHFALNCGATSCPPIRFLEDANFAEFVFLQCQSKIPLKDLFLQNLYPF